MPGWVIARTSTPAVVLNAPVPNHRRAELDRPQTKVPGRISLYQFSRRERLLACLEMPELMLHWHWLWRHCEPDQSLQPAWADCQGGQLLRHLQLSLQLLLHMLACCLQVPLHVPLQGHGYVYAYLSTHSCQLVQAACQSCHQVTQCSSCRVTVSAIIQCFLSGVPYMGVPPCVPVWGAVPAADLPRLAPGWACVAFPCILAAAAARISAALVKLKLDATPAFPTELTGGACAHEMDITCPPL